MFIKTIQIKHITQKKEEKDYSSPKYIFIVTNHPLTSFSVAGIR